MRVYAYVYVKKYVYIYIHTHDPGMSWPPLRMPLEVLLNIFGQVIRLHGEV